LKIAGYKKNTKKRVKVIKLIGLPKTLSYIQLSHFIFAQTITALSARSTLVAQTNFHKIKRDISHPPVVIISAQSSQFVWRGAAFAARKRGVTSKVSESEHVKKNS
jgi:hypothetical protein